ncbi:MAG: energy-coupling factor transporter transmembrane component T family protein [Microbacteriaceae bacterium]
MTDTASWLAHRDPAVKLAALLAVSIATMFLWRPLPVLLLYLASLGAIACVARVSARTMVVGHVPFLAFGIGLLLVNAMSRPGTDLVPGWPIRITVEGIEVGAALAMRGLVIGALTIGFLATTSPRDLLVSLMTRAGLSPRYAHAVLAGHRMLAAMPRSWESIRAAQAVRAPLDRRGRPKDGPVVFVRSAFALLVDAIRSSERIALALESRGLGVGPRTVWRPVPIGWRDAVLAVAVMLAMTAVLGVAWTQR